MAKNVLVTNNIDENVRTETKNILKSRIFRGYYVERRYEESIKDYRDIVALHQSERDLEIALTNVKYKILMHFEQTNTQKTWIGISSEEKQMQQQLPTALWVNLDNLAFGQYWFCIKSIRFFDNEIILKLKTVRPVEKLEFAAESSFCRPSLSESSTAATDRESETPDKKNTTMPAQTFGSKKTTTQDNKNIDIADFIELFQTWHICIKTSLYDFLKNDINKNNMKEIMRFLGLLFVSLVSVSIVGIKQFGVFVLRLLFELSRFIKTITPIVLKLIDVIGKIFGGLYLLLAMLWGGRVQRPTPMQPIKYRPYQKYM